MPHYWFDDRNPIVAWTTYATYQAEVNRGLVHTEEFVADMKELETALRQMQSDLKVYRGVLSQAGEGRSPAGSFDLDRVVI